MTATPADPFDYLGGIDRPPPDDGLSINGLEQAWLSGEVSLEWPCHLFAGFGALPSLHVGAFSYSSSHISPHVVSIGRYCSIAAGVTFGHQEHPTRWLSTSSFTYDANFMGPAPQARLPVSRFQPTPLSFAVKRQRIVIGNDVWIGFNAYIRGGVVLSDGCIVGANAVVTHDVPPFAIVADNPARIVRYRFDRGVIRALTELRWWRFDFRLFEGIDASDVAGSIRRLGVLIDEGLAPFEPPMTILAADTPTPALQARLVAGPVPVQSCRISHPHDLRP